MQKNASALSIPPEWQERFYIKRIAEEPILISLEQRNQILRSLNNGDQFVQIGKYTLMLNTVKSIDPYWEPDNIPPRPKLYEETEIDEERKCFLKTGKNNRDEIDLWDKLFANKLQLKK